MEHRSVEQLKQVAAYYSAQPRNEPMSQRERLKRWAWLLEQQKDRSLQAFVATEYRAPEVRNKMQRAGSPISVAFEDPVLRGEGLRNATYGEAKRFFGLSDIQVHYIVCECHHGAAISARTAAWSVRSAIPRTSGTGFLARAWQFLAG